MTIFMQETNNTNPCERYLGDDMVFSQSPEHIKGIVKKANYHLVNIEIKVQKNE